MHENPFKNAEAGQKRDIPEGRYDLFVTFPHRSGEMKTQRVTMLSVYPDSTEESVVNNMKDWVQMSGLHNFGLKFEGEMSKPALVKASLKTREGVEVMAFECLVDSSGHLVKEKK